MMTRSLMAILSLSLITPKAVLACDFDSVAEPLVTWTKKSVHVCWLPGSAINPKYSKNDFSKNLKTAVQKIVQQEYTLDRVGIEFTGWESCDTLPENGFDLAILQDDRAAPTNKIVEGFRKSQIEGYAILGEGSDFQTVSKFDKKKNKKVTKSGFFKRHLQQPVMYLSYNKKYDNINGTFKSIDELQFTALHELGHVAGLRHEHARKEAKKDPNCSILGEFKNTETYGDTAKFYGEYDANSIMNYCWGNTLLAMGNLYETLPNITDHSLVQSMKLTKTESKTDAKTGKKFTVNTKVNGYQIRLGLSATDVQTLRALYR